MIQSPPPPPARSALGNHPHKVGDHAALYTATQHQPQKPFWDPFVPRTSIEVYTLVLAVATIGLWVFTMRMARSARDTVRAFVEVERADIVVTLENFRERPEGDYDVTTATISVKHTWLEFDVVANNVGRSSALITYVSSGWYGSPDPPKPVILSGPPKKYIANAGKSAVLELSGLKDVGTLSSEPFLLVNVSYKSPLRSGERLIRACFEVYGLRSNIPYKERKHEDVDIAALQRKDSPWWRRLLGARG